jgi:hypothetical protein
MSTSVEQRYKLYQERQQQQEKEPPTSIEQRYQAYLQKNPSRVEPREEVVLWAVLPVQLLVALPQALQELEQGLSFLKLNSKKLKK